MQSNMRKEDQGLRCALVRAVKCEDGRTVVQEAEAVHPLADAEVLRIVERLHDVERTAEAERFFCGLAAHPMERVRAAAVGAGCLTDDAWRRAARDPAYVVREAVAGCAAGVAVLTTEERLELAATLRRTIVEAELRRAAAGLCGKFFPERQDPGVLAEAGRVLEELNRFDAALASAAGVDFMRELGAGLAGYAPLEAPDSGEAADSRELAAEYIRRVVLEHRSARLMPRAFDAWFLGIGRLRDGSNAQDAPDPEAGFVTIDPSRWLELLDLLEPGTAGAVLDYVVSQGRADDRAAAARHEALTLETARLVTRDPCARVRAALLENAGVACRLCAHEVEKLLHDDRSEEEPPSEDDCGRRRRRAADGDSPEPAEELDVLPDRRSGGGDQRIGVER